MPDSERFPSICLNVCNGHGDIKWTQKYKPLCDVEQYLFKCFDKVDVELAFDVTAKERLNFETINYTTYAGFLIMHPLNYEQSVRQMSDAYGDGLSGGHIQHIKAQKTFSKYKLERHAAADPREALVILTGGNKLKKHCCAGKLKQIIEKHGRENVLFKKHPVSYDDVYGELSDFLGGIDYADAYTDLYDLVDGSEYIYTTMKSESALIANIMGKKVDHFDLLHNRHLGSFSHINNFLFTTPDPVSWASQAFASPKSGVVHPDVDSDWQGKVDKYIEYIVDLRDRYRTGYVWV